MSVPSSDPVLAGLPPSDGVAASLPQYDPQVGQALKGLIDHYGVGLFGQAGRLRGLLQDECPQAKREISVLMLALDERVPQDLLRVQSGEPIRSLSPRLTRRLVEEKAMSEPASRWAVQTWAQGLGLEGLQEVDVSSAPVVLPPIGGQPAQDDAHTLPPAPRPDPVLRLPMGLIALAGLVAVGVAGWFAFMHPRLEIAGVDPAGVMVANGKPNPIQLSFQIRNAKPREIEVRYVRGDGNWSSTPTMVAVKDDAGSSGSVTVPAGSLTMRSSKPAKVTFAYTLVAADGRRSEPFERTFDIVPPVVISEVSVPRQLLVGQEFALAIKYQKGPADLVSIERKVISSTVPWGRNEATQTIKYEGESGSFNYRFQPFAQAMNSTVEFTLVDAQGVRSEPYRVSLNVTAPAPVLPPSSLPRLPSGLPLPPGLRMGTVVQVREVRTAGQASGAGAVAAGILGGLAGNQGGRGTGRDILTGLGALGGAIAGNEAEKQLRATTHWEVTVRLDDGGTRTVRQDSAPSWRNGDRVQMDAAGGLVARR